MLKQTYLLKVKCTLTHLTRWHFAKVAWTSKTLRNTSVTISTRTERLVQNRARKAFMQWVQIIFSSKPLAANFHGVALCQRAGLQTKSKFWDALKPEWVGIKEYRMPLQHQGKWKLKVYGQLKTLPSSQVQKQLSLDLTTLGNTVHSAGWCWNVLRHLCKLEHHLLHDKKGFCWAAHGIPQWETTHTLCVTPNSFQRHGRSLEM